MEWDTGAEAFTSHANSLPSQLAFFILVAAYGPSFCFLLRSLPDPSIPVFLFPH